MQSLRGLIRADDAVVVVSAITPDKGKDVHTLMKNLTMGSHLSIFLQQHPCAHVLYISSDAVYADGMSLIRETSCASPTTFHGLMHLARERMLAQALALGRIPLMILRPCTLYGAQDTHHAYGPNRFLRGAMQQRAITLIGEGEEQRDHVALTDLARLIGFCIVHRSDGVLNVATGTSVSFARLARMVAELFEEPVRIDSQPRQSAVTHRHFDVTALMRAFPSWRPTPLREGLLETFRQLREGTHAAQVASAP